MLEGLERVNWSQLGHAYGSAEGVPDLIRRLADDDQFIRREARERLWCSIIHQGTVYSATPHAVHFLVELLQSPQTRDKHELLILLAALARGNFYDKFGVKRLPELTDDWRFLIRARGMTEEEWRVSVLRELEWVEATRSAVFVGIPRYLELLFDPDPEIRYCAAFTLAVGQPRAAEIASEVRRLLKTERDERVIASALFALSCLRGEEHLSLFQLCCDPASSPLVRTVASCLIARLVGERTSLLAVDHLFRALKEPNEIDALWLQIPWSDHESVVCQVCEALSLLGSETTELTVPRMLDALDRLRRWDTASISMVATVLKLVFQRRSEALQFTELTEFQQTVLRRLASSHRAWDWGNVWEFFRDAGLPTSKKELAAFVRREVYAAIPHREPFLLVDDIVEQSDDRIVCRKTFGGDEYFFAGHYPGFPIVPGVLLCEAAMQAGAILLSRHVANESGSVPVATRMNDVKFKRMVRPGETIDIDVSLKERLADAFFLQAKVTVAGQLAVRFEFACTLAQVAELQGEP